MLVRSKLHRNGGTKITFGQGRDRVEYHFKPADLKASLEDNRIDHVAEVSDKEHLGKLLAITEGYEIADGALPAAPQTAAAPRHAAVTGTAEGSARGVRLDASVEAAIAACDPTKCFIFVREGDVVKVAPIDLGRTAPTDAEPPKQPDKPAGKADAKKEQAEAKEKADLVEQVTKKLGKKPHPSTSVKRLKEILAED